MTMDERWRLLRAFKARAKRAVDRMVARKYDARKRKLEDMVEYQKWRSWQMRASAEATAFSSDAYAAIVRCLHPDTAAHATEQERALAFRLFRKEAEKLGPKPQMPPAARNTLPENFDWATARATVRKQNSERAKKAWEARKAKK